MHRMHSLLYHSGALFPWTLMTLTLAGSLPAWGGKFNPKFLENVQGIDQHIDLSIYDSPVARQIPGKYQVSVFVNEQRFASLTLDFRTASEAQNKATGESLIPCLSREQLEEMGVRINAFPALKMSSPEACVAFEEIIPQATSHFDFNNQTLNLSFPQAAMVQTARGTVDPSLWDEGIPAMLLDYSFSGSNGRNEGVDSSPVSTTDSLYLNLRSGINLGPWRLRNNSIWSSNDGENQWDNAGTSLNRAIIPLKSQITFGDTSTPGEIFDSVQMRGAMLTSDDEMLPDSQRGFAPVVRGIAKSNAEVSIEQNGYVIYRTFVQPGAFEINDLYPTSGNGDLTVIIKEADGSEQRFVQPFSAVAIFQREGYLKYSFAAGEYRGGNYDSDTPRFGQLTAMYGLPWGMTAYGGALMSEYYNAFALGVGKNFGQIGAISFDVTQAKSQLQNDESDEGQSYRFLYSKRFGSDTDLRLMGYKYSTRGFYSFQEATDVRSDTSSDINRYHKRSQIQGNLTQQLGDFGSAYANITQQDYWNVSGKQNSLSAGYNGHIGRVNYSIAYTWSQSPEWDEDDRLWSFNISVPLGRAWSSYNMTTDLHGKTSQQASVSGTLLEEHNLNYSIQEGYTNNGEGNSGGTNVGYQGSSGNIDIGYNYSKNTQQVNYAVHGGVIIHSEGITLSQPLGESLAIVSAPGARGTHIVNSGGVEVDWMGNAVVPYLTPYREQVVELRSDSLGENVELQAAFQKVVPTRGAVVRSRFDTRVGYRVLMTLKQADGNAVPFGATAVLNDESKTANGIVGEEGQLYISGMPDKGEIEVSWGKDQGQKCRVLLQLPEEKDNSGIVIVNAVCQK